MRIQSGGQSFQHNLTETWSPTMTLAFIEIDGRKILHQWWTSSAGRTAWRPVIEISKYFADTGET